MSHANEDVSGILAQFRFPRVVPHDSGLMDGPVTDRDAAQERTALETVIRFVIPKRIQVKGERIHAAVDADPGSAEVEPHRRERLTMILSIDIGSRVRMEIRRARRVIGRIHCEYGAGLLRHAVRNKGTARRAVEIIMGEIFAMLVSARRRDVMPDGEWDLMTRRYAAIASSGDPDSGKGTGAHAYLPHCGEGSQIFRDDTSDWTRIDLDAVHADLLDRIDGGCGPVFVIRHGPPEGGAVLFLLELLRAYVRLPELSTADAMRTLVGIEQLPTASPPMHPRRAGPAEDPPG